MKSISSWANRHQTLFNSGVAVFCVLAGFLLNQAFNGPKFFPTAVVLTDAEDRPVDREELTEEARACDAAVRSMLLAFAGEAESAGPTELGFAQRASAAVESPFAIIPEECRSQIDEGFVISADGVNAELRSARLVGDKIAISFVLRNGGVNARHFAIPVDPEAEVKVSAGTVKSVYVSGISLCGTCGRTDFNSAIKIDPGRSILVYVEAALAGEERPDTATIIVPIIRWWHRDAPEEVVFAFNDIPLQGAPKEVDLPLSVGLEAAQ